MWVLACGAIVGAVWVWVQAGKTSSNVAHQPLKNQATLATQQEAVTRDSDSDGLRDWEETLWGTENENPDTDNDGTKDGDEVKVNRDPRKAGPNDILSKEPDPLSTAAGFTGDSASSTALLGESFMKSFLRERILASMRQTGTDKIDAQKLSADLFEGINASLAQEVAKPIPDRFSATEFKKINSNTPEDTKTYVNNLGSLITKNPKQSNINVQETLKQAVEKNDIYAFGQLLEMRDAYTYLAEGMVGIAAPSNLFDSHIEMANGFWRMKVVLDGIGNSTQDSIAGLTMLARYFVEAQLSTVPLQRLVDAIVAQKVVLQESDPGYLFNQYIPEEAE